MRLVFRLRGRMSVPVVGLVAVLAVVIGSGAVAYAGNGAGGGGCDGSHGCPSGGIFWTSVSTPTPSASTVTCTASITESTNTLVEGASYLIAGQSCTFFAKLTNTAQFTVSITEKVTPTQPASCKLYAYVDNVASASPIPSSHYFSYEGTLSLSSSAPPSCEGTTAMFSVTITATQAPKCY